MRKGALEKLLGVGNYDLVLLQEIRSSGDVPLTIMGMGYEAYPFPAIKPGYAGVMTLTRIHQSRSLRVLGLRNLMLRVGSSRWSLTNFT